MFRLEAPAKPPPVAVEDQSQSDREGRQSDQRAFDPADPASVRPASLGATEQEEAQEQSAGSEKRSGERKSSVPALQAVRRRIRLREARPEPFLAALFEERLQAVRARNGLRMLAKLRLEVGPRATRHQAFSILYPRARMVFSASIAVRRS